MEFNRKEADVMAEIERLQSSIPGLCFHGSYQATSTGPLVPGCEICTRMTHMSFQLGFRCNANCPFCFLHTYQADAPNEDEKYNRQALLKEFHRRKDELEGVSLPGGEPLYTSLDWELAYPKCGEPSLDYTFGYTPTASSPMT